VGGRGVDIVPPLCILKLGIPIAWQENGPPQVRKGRGVLIQDCLRLVIPWLVKNNIKPIDITSGVQYLFVLVLFYYPEFIGLNISKAFKFSV